MLNDLNNRSHSTGTPIDYSHKYLVDTFYPASENPHNKDKIRVTRDEKSGNVIECMKKIRLGDLNISSPKRAADWRVSVNLEVPVPPPVGTSTHTRRKDRISYSHEECRIDLTQVTASANGLGGPVSVHTPILHPRKLSMILNSQRFCTNSRSKLPVLLSSWLLLPSGAIPTRLKRNVMRSTNLFACS